MLESPARHGFESKYVGVRPGQAGRLLPKTAGFVAVLEGNCNPGRRSPPVATCRVRDEKFLVTVTAHSHASACLQLRHLDPIRLRLEYGKQVDAISHLLG
jgi:hypothetical protein